MQDTQNDGLQFIEKSSTDNVLTKLMGIKKCSLSPCYTIPHPISYTNTTAAETKPHLHALMVAEYATTFGVGPDCESIIRANGHCWPGPLDDTTTGTPPACSESQ